MKLNARKARTLHNVYNICCELHESQNHENKVLCFLGTGKSATEVKDDNLDKTIFVGNLSEKTTKKSLKAHFDR
jgi:RNA recognition motif-containing protein